MVNKRARNAVLGCNLKNDRMISVRLQGKPFNITVIQVYASTSNAEETEVERFYEDLQDLLELTPQKKSWLKAQHSENEDHGIWSHHFMGNTWGNGVRLYFGGLQNHCRW